MGRQGYYQNTWGWGNPERESDNVTDAQHDGEVFTDNGGG